MNNAVLFIWLFILISFSCRSQNQPDCNRKVRIKSDIKLIPEGVCLAEGYEFSYVYDHADVTGNRIKDFITQWRKQNIEDGDTLYLSIYQQLDSNNYVLLKTLDNIYPIYFKRYELDYIVRDSILNELQGSYGGTNPLNQIDFGEGKIVIELQPGVLDYYFLHYRYDPEVKDWFLERRIYSEKDYEGNLHEKTNEYLWDQRISIEKFSYFDYL